MERLVTGFPSFEGPRACTHCFTHIISLVAKSLLRLFDNSRKKKATKDEGSGEEYNTRGQLQKKELGVDVKELLAQLTLCKGSVLTVNTTCTESQSSIPFVLRPY